MRHSFLSIGYTLEYAPCYNGNISKRTWSEGSYTYTYDAFNRLSSAVFTPAEGLADRPSVERDRIPDFSVYYDYDLRGNTTNVVRYGVVDAVSDFDRVETFGTLDELACAYDGNRLSNITAITEALPFDGVTGLHADGEFERRTTMPATSRATDSAAYMATMRVHIPATDMCCAAARATVSPTSPMTNK